MKGIIGTRVASYDYECPSEGFKSTVERPMAEDEPDYFCGSCGNKLRRIFTAPPVKFNGTGFYSTGG